MKCFGIKKYKSETYLKIRNTDNTNCFIPEWMADPEAKKYKLTKKPIISYTALKNIRIYINSHLSSFHGIKRNKYNHGEKNGRKIFSAVASVPKIRRIHKQNIKGFKEANNTSTE